MSIYLLNEESFAQELSNEDVDNVKLHAQNGEAEAQYHLALMLDSGVGIKRNPKEAELWYKKAAEQGHGAAKYFLAKMYSTENSGIAKNDAEAERLFMESAQQGNQMALEKISELAY